MAIEATKGLRLSGPGVLLATLCVSAFRSAEHFNAEARSRDGKEEVSSSYVLVHQRQLIL